MFNNINLHSPVKKIKEIHNNLILLTEEKWCIHVTKKQRDLGEMKQTRILKEKHFYSTGRQRGMQRKYSREKKYGVNHKNLIYCLQKKSSPSCASLTSQLVPVIVSNSFLQLKPPWPCPEPLCIDILMLQCKTRQLTLLYAFLTSLFYLLPCNKIIMQLYFYIRYKQKLTNI